MMKNREMMKKIGSALKNRPLLARPHWGAWVVLLAMLPFGLWGYHIYDQIGFFTWDPTGLGEAGRKMGANYLAYHRGAELALAGEAFSGIMHHDSF